MTIRKRGQNWQVDYVDINGKRIRTTYKTKKEAELVHAEAVTSKAKGLVSSIDTRITFEDSCKYFIEKYLLINKKPKTISEYERIINKELLPYFKNRRLAQISKLDVENFKVSLIKRKLKATTINKYLIVLGSIIERQVENEILFQNVVKKVKKIKSTKYVGRSLNQNEVSRLLDVCKEVKPEFYPMLFTVLNTGMRRGEIVALMWKNVDFDKNLINVEYTGYKGTLHAPKSAKSVRKIYMTNSLRKLLLEYKLKSGKNEFVFSNNNGTMLDGQNVYNRLFKPVMKKCGIGHFRFHDLRHTYGSFLVENLVPIKFVQEQMGHSSSQITLDIYTHVGDKSKELALNILDKIYA